AQARRAPRYAPALSSARGRPQVDRAVGRLRDERDRSPRDPRLEVAEDVALAGHLDAELVDGTRVEAVVPQERDERVTVGNAWNLYVHWQSVPDCTTAKTRYRPRRWRLRPSGSTGSSSQARRPSRRPAASGS